MHPEHPGVVVQPRDKIVHSPHGRLPDTLDDVLAVGSQVVHRVAQATQAPRLVVRAALSGHVDPARRLRLLVLVRQLADPRLPPRVNWHAHGVDERQILPGDDLGQVPAQGPVGPCEVVHFLELVRLVQHEGHLVLHPGETGPHACKRLAGCTGFIRVEEQEHHVGSLGEPSDHAGEVVSPVPRAGVGSDPRVAFLCRRASQARPRGIHSVVVVTGAARATSRPAVAPGPMLGQALDGHWAIDHAGAVHHHDVP